jgi:HlyD family secretion protein
MDITKPLKVTSSVLLAALLVLAGVSCSKGKTAEAKKQSYEFATLSKGSIESTVASSGTLGVVSSVNVLAQMSGRIEKVKVDYNDRVKSGQVLATINTDLLRLQAKAAQASVDKARANYDLQALAAQNAKALFDKELLSEYDYKAARSTLDVNKAELAQAEAALEQIETEINQYAYITSPIDGIVLERNVDSGSSVTGGSSSASTSLFTLAQDLSKMEIKAEVDELDISSIEAGQEVRFTVEANPGTTYSGAVKEVRLVPETSENLVYYYVIILADNSSGKLLPGMTASVTFIKQRKDDALTVPSAAFRFTPSALGADEKARALFAASLPSDMPEERRQKALAGYDEAAKERAGAKASGKPAPAGGLSTLMSGRMMGPPPGGGGGARASSAQGQGAQAAAWRSKDSASPTASRKPLWYLDDSGKLAAMLVEVGMSDGTRTEIVGADSLEGRKVILKVKAE